MPLQTHSSEITVAQPFNYPPTRVGSWVVAVFFLTAVISSTDRLILSVLVDGLRADLGISDFGVSILQGVAFTFVYVFASLPLGRVADQHQRKGLLIAGSILWCSATVLCGLARSFSVLFIGRLLIGIGEASLAPAAVSMIADSFPPKRRGTAIGVFAMGGIIGGPLGITAGGFLLSAAQRGRFWAWPLIGGLAPWRAVLVILGLIGILAPLLLLTIREPERLETMREVHLKAVGRQFIADRGRLLPLYLALALFAVGDYGLLSWAPTALTRRFAWPSSEVGLAFGAITAFAGVAGATGGGWISDLAERRGGTRARLSLCMFATLLGASAAVLIVAHQVHLVLLGIGLWGLSSSIGGISGVSALQEMVPNQLRGTGVSLVSFWNTLIGLGCGPTLVSLVTEHVYASSSSVAYAISTVAGPAALLACIAFGTSRRTFNRA